MTKNILILPLLAITFAHGMEINSLPAINSWIISYNKTKITLTQETLYNIKNKVELTVIGTNHQNELLKDQKKRIVFFPYYEVSKTCLTNYVLFDNGSTVFAQRGTMPFLQVTEPFITHVSHNSIYHVVRNIRHFEFKNDQAIKEASKDLTLCYEETLNRGLLGLNKKSIALPTLSTEVGFPEDKAAPIAVETVIQFIKNNQHYDDIYLVVKKDSEFNLYKSLLIQHTGLLYKIYLFYWTHKDQEKNLSLLPREIRDYIIQLI